MSTRVIQIVQNADISSVIYPWILIPFLLVSCDPVRAVWWNKNFLTLHSNRDENQVQITQLYERKNMLRLRCDARGPNASESLVLLGCPSVETGFCRENCISPCLIVGASPECSGETQTPIQYCRYRVVSADHVRVDYKVKLESENDSGRWWCMFRGHSSDPVILQYQSPEVYKTTESFLPNGTDHLVTIVTQATSPENTSNDQTVVLESSNTLYSSNNEENSPFLFVTKMPFELMIAIIIFVCLSVIFNMVFFIRCCMINNYLKKLHKGGPRNSCYDQLLCMGRSKLLPNRSRLNYIRIPDHKSSLLVYPSSPTLSTIRPGSTVFLPNTNNLHSASSPIYPTGINSPVLIRNMTSSTAQYETQPGMELIYDDVNHSTTYTTVNTGNKTPTTTPLMPVVSTPDGRTWVLDRTGRVYLPCAQASTPFNYETHVTHVAPVALPYESNGRALNCIPEYEQDEIFRGSVPLPNKRSATPLPNRPVQSSVAPRADSTPPLGFTGVQSQSVRDLMQSPHPGNQAKFVAPLPFPYLQTRPTEVISLPAVNLYPFIHPLSVIDLSNRATLSPPLPPTPPASMRAQSIPFLRSNSDRLQLSPPKRSPEPNTHPVE